MAHIESQERMEEKMSEEEKEEKHVCKGRGTIRGYHIEARVSSMIPSNPVILEDQFGHKVVLSTEWTSIHIKIGNRLSDIAGGLFEHESQAIACAWKIIGDNPYGRIEVRVIQETMNYTFEKEQTGERIISEKDLKEEKTG